MGDCAGGVVVVAGAVAVGDVVVVAAVVGGWIAGSDFSPQPAAATASPAVTSATGSAVRHPRSGFTGGHANGFLQRNSTSTSGLPATHSSTLP